MSVFDIALDKIEHLEAEIERLRASVKTMVNEREQERKVYNDAIARHLADNEQLRGASVHDWGYWYVDKRVYDELCAEIEQLKAGMREYACTGSDHPCGCYDQFLSERTELERLRDLLAFNGIDPDATIEAAKGAASAGERR